MLVDLVKVTNSAGVVLDGAYFAPECPLNITGMDCVLFFHGDGGNFYGDLYLTIGQSFASKGLAFLSANRTGHDLITGRGVGSRLGGYAFERVSDSLSDISAWIQFLKGRGHSKILLGGHSGGAVRSVYAQAVLGFDNVIAIAGVSPGEYNHNIVSESHGPQFNVLYKQAVNAVENGNGDELIKPGYPWGSIWSKETFVDHFHVDNRYSVTKHAFNTAVPTLFIFGSEECRVGGDQELPVCGAAKRGLVEAAYPHVTIKVVEGANHGYKARINEMVYEVCNWFESL
jgi:hypothetical protein